MRLTPLDIRKQEFSHKMRGYDVDEVTAFLQMLANQWEELQDENRRREEKIRELGGKLRHYEKVEEALQEALQTARESSRAVLQNAEEKASLMIARAEARADEITQQAERERHDLKRETATLSGRRSEIVTRLRAFLMSEMEMLARYEGDDPVGFIRLLPSEEGKTRRLTERPGQHHVAEGRASGGGPAAEGRNAPGDSAAEQAGEASPRPPHRTPPHGTPAQEAPPTEATPQEATPQETAPQTRPPQEASPQATGNDEASAPDPLRTPSMEPSSEPSQPRAPAVPAPQQAQPHPPDSQHAAGSHDLSDDEAQPDVPPATASPSMLHETGEGGPHGSRDPGDAGPNPPSDRKRDGENVVEGPGWTARTVVSRPSEQRSTPPDPTRHAGHGEHAGEGVRETESEREHEDEHDDEVQGGASSEEIEKIRRILSGLD